MPSQAVIHCEIVRQAARVVAMDCERVRSGDRACVRFRWAGSWVAAQRRGPG
jgi:GTPase